MFRSLFRKVLNFIVSAMTGNLTSPSESALSTGPEFETGSLTLSRKGLDFIACIAPKVWVLRDLHSPPITTIEWCKSRISPYHEFIIAYSDKWVLLVERLVAYPDGRTPMVVTGEQQPLVPEDERAIDDLTKEEKAKILPDQAVTTGTAVDPPQDTEMPPGTTKTNDESQFCACPRNPKTGAQIQPRLHSQYGRKPLTSSSASSSLDSIKTFSPLEVRESQDTMWLGDVKRSSVVANRQNTHQYDVMSILTLRDSFSISQLAILACVVHRHAPAYSLLEYQCYWYAKMVYNYVKESVGSTEELKALASRRGTFGTLPVPKGHKNSLDLIKQQFKVDWDRFYNRLLRERQEKEEKEQQEKAEREAEKQRVRELENQAARNKAEAARNKAEAARNKAEAERQKKLKEEAEQEVARAKQEADRYKKQCEELRAQLEHSQTVRA